VYPRVSTLAELYLCPLEPELGGGASSLEQLIIVAVLELELELTVLLELLNFAALELYSGLFSAAELEESSLSPQKTSNKLNLPSLHPKTATVKAKANKNKRIFAI